MNIQLGEDYEDMSRQTAEFIAAYVRRKPDAVLCFPAGDTPVGTFRRLIELSRERQVDFSRSKWVGLDEWAGMGRLDDGSCQGFMYDNLFTPLAILEENIFFFDACAPDLARECVRMDETVSRLGGIDLMFVGIGMNGHIGLNEPGTNIDSYSHVVELDSVTRTVGQKYFSREIKLEQGITLGMRHLMEAETALLAVSGSKKAGIVRQALEGPVSEKVPGSYLQKHRNSHVFLDREAASELDIILPGDTAVQ
ncbi:glucosamine-6-phosphate deaminase [Cohnella pontilimi]|uniref:Glucosamine-6-phosphate deaminase n=1 Tax=Cohnella pontilimi TaxID=2564100 RepID=A0A4V5LSF3_9BACL|nr:glucosamine-6-phosphate deaminase [Cohnella pontilimi]TJY42879.1 glucosamine-6-phosphate deaminase [Cohnella pontilimi]